jgi:2-haloacid dehalogenase
LTELDFSRFDALTFDCYGTLIDWEAGLAEALRGVAAAHGLATPDEALLEAFARHEAALEAGRYRPYREVLGEALRAILGEHAQEPTAAEIAAFGGSVADWPAFPDSATALRRLQARFGLGVITNCDDDLYKPNPRGFELAFERIGLPPKRILHVAQSLYHDHVPAKALGLSTVWVNRRHGRPGSGATPPAQATPDLVVPDMATLADLATSA